MARNSNSAAAHLRSAVEISRQAGRPVYIAHALLSLSEAYTAIGDLDRAREARLESLKLFKQTSLPVPEDLTRAIADQGQLTHSSVPSVNT